MNSLRATRPSVFAPTSMTATSFSMATTVPLTTDPSWTSVFSNDSANIAAKSSRDGDCCKAADIRSPGARLGRRRRLVFWDAPSRRSSGPPRRSPKPNRSLSGPAHHSDRERIRRGVGDRCSQRRQSITPGRSRCSANPPDPQDGSQGLGERGGVAPTRRPSASPRGTGLGSARSLQTASRGGTGCRPLDDYF